MVFDRQESGECTSRVVFPEVRVSAALPAYERTTVRLTPREAGSFGFACGVNMIHGRLIVEAAAAAGEEHRIGWLTLRHRAADMNSLITLGTSAAYGYSPPSSDTVNSRGHSGMCDSCTCSTEAKTTTDITIDTSAPTAVDTYTVVGMTCGH